MTDQLEQRHSPTLLERTGGVSGLAYASLPTFSYVIANAIADLETAVLMSVGVSAGLIVLRLSRMQPIQPAASGLLGVDLAALAFAALFSARFVVQQWLYGSGFSGWLAFARIAMGYPLLGTVLVVVYWAVRRANRDSPITVSPTCGAAQRK